VVLFSADDKPSDLANGKKIVSVAIDYEYTPLTYKSFQGKPEGLLVRARSLKNY